MKILGAPNYSLLYDFWRVRGLKIPPHHTFLEKYFSNFIQNW